MVRPVHLVAIHEVARESYLTPSRSYAPCVCPIGAIGALMNRVLQPRPLIVLGLNVWMGTAAGADELVEIPTDASYGRSVWAYSVQRA